MSIEISVPDSHARCVNPSKLEIPTAFLESTPGMVPAIYRQAGRVGPGDIVKPGLHAVPNVKTIRAIVETLISSPKPVTMLQEYQEQPKYH